MIHEKNKFLNASWLSGHISAEIFISKGEWGIQMPTLTEENSQYLWSGSREISLLTHWGRDKMAAIFQWIFLNEITWISMKISLKFVPRGSINNIPALVHLMAWRRPGDKPLSEPMMVRLPTHICVTQPQWVPKGLIDNMSALVQVMAWCLAGDKP